MYRRNWYLPSLLILVALLMFAIGCSKSEPTPAARQTPTPTATLPPKPANPEIIMSSTTSTRDSGLMDVLIPLFQQKSGYAVKPIYVGTGAAINMGQQGNADVVLVHAPSLEKPFVNSGVGINRRLVMHNDFVIVGPPSDPAGIKGLAKAADAFKKIADARATFYSRGDKSGTDIMEKGIFNSIGVKVADGAATNPSWYSEGGAGMGMLDLLRISSEKDAYTLSDRATYLVNKGVLSLDILTQGDPVLLNIYHVIQVNPDKFPNVNAAGAKAFSDFTVSTEAQTIIADYGKDKYGQPLFFPDAGKTEAELGSY